MTSSPTGIPSSRRETCRICKGRKLHYFLSLGEQPHCNRFLRKEDLAKPEPHYPIDVAFCEDCALVQLGYTVPPETMYLDHPYVSGTTITLPQHFQKMARIIVDRRRLGPSSLVVDIGSNDGTWLKAFRDLGTRTLGVEPAAKIAQLARDAGIDTVTEFFSSGLAARIRAEKGPAHAITAAGVFFHIEDLDDVVRGVQALLADDGVFVIQAMYLPDILEKVAFDAIYHEHLVYYSLKPLTVLFDRYGMEIVDVERLAIHGGSFIITVQKKGRSTPAPVVALTLDQERKDGIYSLDTYTRFAERVAGIRTKLIALLTDLKARGKRVAGYGASARGNTLLNYCEIGPDLLQYVVEKNSLKCGLYTPGRHLPVVPEDSVKNAPPDFYLVLAWNFFDEFVKKEKAYHNAGGRFILPVPEPRIV